jgi:hypothetical protein|tara:strand:- start:170 stop:793 length:624 start_codon:yes stop_codon:yes gene_type:complete
MKISKSKLKKIIKEEVDLFSFALENPFSVGLPEDLAFHPMVQEKRRTLTAERFQKKYEKCKQIAAAGGLSDTGGRKLKIGTGQVGGDLYDKKDELELERGKLKAEEEKIAFLIRKNGPSPKYDKQLDNIVDRILEIGKEIESLGGEWSQRIRQDLDKTEYEQMFQQEGCGLLIISFKGDSDFNFKVDMAEREYERRWSANKKRSSRR